MPFFTAALVVGAGCRADTPASDSSPTAPRSPAPLRDKVKGHLRVNVHYDYLVFDGPDAHSDAPDPAYIQQVVDAFAAQGVDLVIDPQHTAIPGQPLMWFGSDGVHLCRNGVQDVYSLGAQYFQAPKNEEWHYAVFGDAVTDYDCSASTGEGGIADVNGDNLVVVTRHGDGPSPAHLVAGTFMHELGHNLGLEHGGDEPLNYKPNYLSVMNYWFQGGIPYGAAPGSTTIIGTRLDYSGMALPILDESHLNEPLGIQGTTADITVYSDPVDHGAWFGPASGPIDWNLNGSATDGDVAVDLVDYYACFCKTPLQTLHGFDDWSAIRAVLSGTKVRGPKRIVHEHLPNQPQVDSIAPNTGSPTGGTAVTIYGRALGHVTQVLFGWGRSAVFSIVNDNRIIATAPPAGTLSGLVTSVVLVADSTPNQIAPQDQFSYASLVPVITSISPTSGPPGTVITAHGTTMSGVTSAGFYVSGDGSDAASGVQVIDDHTVIVQSPDLIGGTQHVLLYNAYGASVPTANDLFTFVIPTVPTVTSVSPASGPVTGGTSITIHGSGFLGARSVSIASSFTVVDDATIIAVTSGVEAIGPGVRHVIVTNSAGSNTQGASDVFTYF